MKKLIDSLKIKLSKSMGLMRIMKILAHLILFIQIRNLQIDD